MGEVYEALEHPIGRKVALKVIAQRTDAAGQEALLRFMTEAKALSQVSHHNVVSLFAIGQHENLHYIAMEHIEGVVLRDLMSEYILSASEAAALAVQIMSGLKALHEQKIIHRDLTPKNIIVQPNGRAVIIDLGIAKQIGQADLTSTGMVIGTFSYMAPEIFYGMPATVRTDLWAAGAILYEATSGQSLAAKSGSVNATEYPRESQSWTPMPFRKAITRLCAPKPEDRFSTAAEAEIEFERLSEGRLESGTMALAALAQTVENLTLVKDMIAKAKVSSIAARRVLAVSAQLAKARLGPSSGVDDKTQFIDPDTTVKIDIRAVHEALDQVRFPMGMRIQQRQIIPRESRKAPITAFAVMTVAVIGIGGFVFLNSKPNSKSVFEMKKVSALNESEIWLGGKENVKLKWAPRLDQGAVLEIDSHPDFRMPERHRVAGDSAEIARPRDGKYYWRLAKDSKYSMPFQFQVWTYMAPKLLKPPPDENIAVPETSDNRIVIIDFTWECHPGAKSYRVQISRYVSFKEIFSEQELVDCKWLAVTIPKGKYFWRVRTESPAVARQWSEPRGLSISRTKEEPNLENERSLSSLPNFELNSQFPIPAPLKPIHATRLQRVKGVPVDVSWSKVQGASGYMVEFSPDLNFGSPIRRRTEASEIQYRSKWINSDDIFWRVRAESSDAKVSNWSPVRHFKIRRSIADQ